MEKPGELQQSLNTAVLATEQIDEKQEAASDLSSPVAEKSTAQVDSEAALPSPEPKRVHTAREWSAWRKIITVAFVAIFAFLSTSGAAIVAPAREKIAAQFNVSRTASILPLSMYNIGLALGPIVWSPLSEQVGRQPMYIITMPMLLLFNMASGFSPTFAGLLICRLIAGTCASTGITLASATIADMFAPGNARRYAIYSYYSMPWLGAVLGALIGYPIIAHLNWQWTEWIYLCYATPIVIPGLLFMRETKLSALERAAATDTKAQALSWLNPHKVAHQAVVIMKAVPNFLRRAILRPLQMLLTELIVALVCLYAGFSFALVYALVVVLGDIYGTVYGFTTVQQGLAFIPLLVGVIAGPVTLIAVQKFKQAKQNKADGSRPATTEKPPPEASLQGAMVGGVILPAGLIWMAWTLQPQIHWLVPMFASVFITWGARMVYVSNSAYMTDVYGPVYGASAQAASSITRYSLAAGIPLFILQMYEGLGVNWATSLLALCAALMMPIPFCFFYWGAQLRARCKFQTEN